MKVACYTVLRNMKASPRSVPVHRSVLEDGIKKFIFLIHRVIIILGPRLWSSGQSFWLQMQRSWVRFLVLPDFLRSRRSEMGSTQPREDN
jgi:hypothetical protein